MKFLIVVPGKIAKTFGSSTKTEFTELETNEELIYQALTLNDYQENVFFEKGRIKVKKVGSSRNRKSWFWRFIDFFRT